MCRLAEMSYEGRIATIGWLAERENLPRKYLEQVLRDLKQAHLIESKPGPNGGCWLAKAPGEISINDVVRALDGEIRPGHCLDTAAQGNEDDCPGCWGFSTCSLREIWVDLEQTIGEVLSKTSLENLVERQRQLKPAPLGDYQI